MGALKIRRARRVRPVVVVLSQEEMDRRWTAATKDATTDFILERRQENSLRAREQACHEDLSRANSPHVCIVQDEQTKEVIAVLHERNDFESYQVDCAKRGVDLSRAELIDKPLWVGYGT